MPMSNPLPMFALTGLMALLGPSVQARADDFTLEEGFTRLDNSQDLEGWTGNLTGWSVRDGAIHLERFTLGSPTNLRRGAEKRA